MAVLSYNEILPKTVIVYNGEPYEVLSSHVFRMQMRKPVNQTKLRNLISGKVTEISFHQNETVPEAEVGKMSAKYLYTSRGESWFCDEKNPKNRFAFPEEAVRERVQWLAPNATTEVVTFEDRPITVTIPVKVDLEVTEAPPNIKGDSATGGNKPVKVATGAMVNVPLFINAGDIIRINTDTGVYAERIEKAK